MATCRGNLLWNIASVLSLDAVRTVKAKGKGLPIKMRQQVNDKKLTVRAPASTRVINNYSAMWEEKVTIWSDMKPLLNYQGEKAGASLISSQWCHFDHLVTTFARVTSLYGLDAFLEAMNNTQGYRTTLLKSVIFTLLRSVTAIILLRRCIISLLFLQCSYEH